MQVEKKSKESPTTLIRRFTQRIRESRILIDAKKSYFYDQGLSRNRRRKNALERVKNRAIKVRLRKMGKL